MKKTIMAISVLDLLFSCIKKINLNNQAPDAVLAVDISNANLLNRQTKFGAMLLSDIRSKPHFPQPPCAVNFFYTK